MGFSDVTYALSKRYTNETAIQFGGLKGAPCKIKAINKFNGQTVITFEWKNDEGETRESKAYINDGTPIYDWTAGFEYNTGDLAIYTTNFYKCLVHNNDYEFDIRKWQKIGGSDSDMIPISIEEIQELFP